MSDVVGIVGAGARTEMLLHLIGSNKGSAVVWPAFEDALDARARRRVKKRLVESGADLVESGEALAAAARLVFLSAPSWRLREVARRLGPHLSGFQTLVHTARGIESETHATGTEVIRAETPVRLTGALVGPIHAPDQLDGKPGAAVVGSRFPGVIQRVQSALAGPMFRVYGNADLIGVEIGGAAAGLLAVAVGLADGLDLGSGVRGALFARGVAELTRLGVAFGGAPRTLTGMAGLGYLAATTSPPVGVEMSIGRAIAAGKAFEEVAARFPQESRELVAACEAVTEAAARRGVEAHITAAVAKVLVQGEPAAAAVVELLSLGQMME
jgi:glycerol-3-phosphate dehydrogenase (NAD(P)+)